MKVDYIKTQIFKFEKKEDFNFPLAEEIVEKESMAASDSWSPNCVIDDFKEIAEALGFYVDDVDFTGFYSQGDGAMFTGTWERPEKDPVEAVKAIAPLDSELETLAQYIKDIDICLERVEIEQDKSWRYNHSGTMYIDDLECNDDCDISDNECTYEAEKVLDVARELADWLYKQLEEDYESVTDEENVKEYIINEGYWHDCNGNKYYEKPETVKCLK